jgi:hypothetical protein
MSEETKKVEQIEREAKSAELSEQDLEQVAGGATKKPATGNSTTTSWETHEIKV